MLLRAQLVVQYCRAKSYEVRVLVLFLLVLVYGSNGTR